MADFQETLAAKINADADFTTVLPETARVLLMQGECELPVGETAAQKHVKIFQGIAIRLEFRRFFTLYFSKLA
jgi:hypothetical protein